MEFHSLENCSRYLNEVRAAKKLYFSREGSLTLLFDMISRGRDRNFAACVFLKDIKKFLENSAAHFHFLETTEPLTCPETTVKMIDKHAIKPNDRNTGIRDFPNNPIINQKRNLSINGVKHQHASSGESKPIAQRWKLQHREKNPALRRHSSQNPANRPQIARRDSVAPQMRPVAPSRKYASPKLSPKIQMDLQPKAPRPIPAYIRRANSRRESSLFGNEKVDKHGPQMKSNIYHAPGEKKSNQSDFKTRISLPGVPRDQLALQRPSRIPSVSNKSSGSQRPLLTTKSTVIEQPIRSRQFMVTKQPSKSTYRNAVETSNGFLAQKCVPKNNKPRTSLPSYFRASRAIPGRPSIVHDSGMALHARRSTHHQYTSNAPSSFKQSIINDTKQGYSSRQTPEKFPSQEKRLKYGNQETDKRQTIGTMEDESNNIPGRETHHQKSRFRQHYSLVGPRFKSIGAMDKNKDHSPKLQGTHARNWLAKYRPRSSLLPTKLSQNSDPFYLIHGMPQVSRSSTQTANSQKESTNGHFSIHKNLNANHRI